MPKAATVHNLSRSKPYSSSSSRSRGIRKSLNKSAIHKTKQKTSRIPLQDINTNTKSIAMTDEELENSLLNSDVEDNTTQASLSELTKLVKSIKKEQCTKNDLQAYSESVNKQIKSVSDKLVIQDKSMGGINKKK